MKNASVMAYSVENSLLLIAAPLLFSSYSFILALLPTYDHLFPNCRVKTFIPWRIELIFVFYSRKPFPIFQIFLLVEAAIPCVVFLLPLNHLLGYWLGGFSLLIIFLLNYETSFFFLCPDLALLLL